VDIIIISSNVTCSRLDVAEILLMPRYTTITRYYTNFSHFRLYLSQA